MVKPWRSARRQVERVQEHEGLGRSAVPVSCHGCLVWLLSPPTKAFAASAASAKEGSAASAATPIGDSVEALAVIHKEVRETN